MVKSLKNGVVLPTVLKELTFKAGLSNTAVTEEIREYVINHFKRFSNPTGLSRHVLATIELSLLTGFVSLQTLIDDCITKYETNDAELIKPSANETLKGKDLTDLLKKLINIAPLQTGGADIVTKVLISEYYLSPELNYKFAMDLLSAKTLPQDIAFEIEQAVIAGRDILKFFESLKEVALDDVRAKITEIIESYKTQTIGQFKRKAEESLANS
jgi:hypothetical protein